MSRNLELHKPSLPIADIHSHPWGKGLWQCQKEITQRTWILHCKAIQYIPYDEKTAKSGYKYVAHRLDIYIRGEDDEEADILDTWMQMIHTQATVLQFARICSIKTYYLNHSGLSDVLVCLFLVFSSSLSLCTIVQESTVPRASGHSFCIVPIWLIVVSRR